MGVFSPMLMFVLFGLIQSLSFFETLSFNPFVSVLLVTYLFYAIKQISTTAFDNFKAYITSLRLASWD